MIKFVHTSVHFECRMISKENAHRLMYREQFNFFLLYNFFFWIFRLYLLRLSTTKEAYGTEIY